MSVMGKVSDTKRCKQKTCQFFSIFLHMDYLGAGFLFNPFAGLRADHFRPLINLGFQRIESFAVISFFLQSISRHKSFQMSKIHYYRVSMRSCSIGVAAIGLERANSHRVSRE